MVSRLSLPDKKNYEYGYELAFKLAREQLAKIADIKQQCQKSGAQYQVKDSQKVITVEYLNRHYEVTLPNIEISAKNSGEAVPLRDKILILHYLIQAKGTPLSNKTITYKELPEGLIYFPTFVKRAVKPLTDHFGKEPRRLIDTATLLGGKKVEYGDAAVTINAFRRVLITLVMWQGDEEFHPEASILFDSTITDYLTVEDIHVLCETIAWRLVKSDKQR